MKNQNAVFLIFSLSLTVGILTAYASFVGYFNDHEVYEAKVARLEKQVEKERFNNALLTYQIKDFQQSVAQILPDNKQLQAKYEMKNLAAVVRATASEDAVDLSGVMFVKGKRYFNGNQYDQAIREFSQLVEKYPLSPHGVEAKFLIAESYFLKKDFRSSLTEIDEMVTQFPQHDLTGFILLRMGQISEINNQGEEAAEIYKTVAKNFKNEELRNQARKLAQSVEF
jgi:TolA-binding protein